MCGNYFPDLDATIGKFQFTYLNLYGSEKFVQAAEVLYLANCSLPAEAAVSDLPHFVQTEYHLRAEHKLEEQAREYCNKYAGVIMRSIANYRSDMLKKLDDD